jgi:hypothetical protein
VRYPKVPVVFADSRRLAEEWTYRFLSSALADVSLGSVDRGEVPRTSQKGATGQSSSRIGLTSLCTFWDGV